MSYSYHYIWEKDLTQQQKHCALKKLGSRKPAALAAG